MTDKEKRTEIGRLLKKDIHLYQFNGPVSKQEIQEIETNLEILIPIDYQWFLRNLGWIQRKTDGNRILGVEEKELFTVFHPQKEAKYVESVWDEDSSILVLEIVTETENLKIIRYIHAVDFLQETAPVWEARLQGDYWNRLSNPIKKELVCPSFYDYFIDFLTK